MTTRIDHTDCSHDSTPKARAWCRADRVRRIKECQTRYLEVAADPNFSGQSEYEAMIDLLAGFLGMELRATYDLVENGPVL